MDIANYVRIFDLAPTDELVEKRAAATKDLASRLIKKQTVDVSFKLADELISGCQPGHALPSAMSELIESSIRKSAKAFSSEGQGLQTLVVGLLGALQALKGNQQASHDLLTLDVFAMALVSGLSFQNHVEEVRLEALRHDVLSSAEKVLSLRAIASRSREPVNLEPPKPLTELTPENLTSAFAYDATALSALRSNAALDREEIDLLWWILSDWSHILGRRFSSPDNPVSSLIASGMEFATLLRRLPATAHERLVARNAPAVDPISLSELVERLGEDRKLLAKPYDQNDVISRCPHVFPLLNALIGTAEPTLAWSIRRSSDEWVRRALLECGALHITSHLPKLVA